MDLRLATLEQDSYYLDNGVEANRKHPETFWIPEAGRREDVKPGQLVKLRFVIRTVDEAGNEELNGERMWVRVDAHEGEFYIGTLDNDAACSNDISSGMQIIFKPEHVIDIWR